LVDSLTSVLRGVLGQTFYPVLQRAIGFGSAFEGWTASEEEVVYRVLIPLKPPLGHVFCLKPDTEQQRLGRPFRVLVKLECRCLREQEGVFQLCYLHHANMVRRVTGQPNLLDTLCTDSYLDVKKTVRWFCALVRASWWCLPQSRSWDLALLPSKDSCNLRLTNSQESFQVRLLFGVQRHGSDIFITSQSQGADTPSTMWPETYTVAETKFFKHVASQLPQDSSHLRCLQILTGVLMHEGFSAHAIKTVVMRLLSTLPAAEWHKRYFLLQLSNILLQLCSYLEEKQLEHFIVGNQRLPQEIRLPPDVQTARPANLFQSLVQDPAAYSQAMQACRDL
ncbi:IPIL1 protein, partial [Paradoxornis webbianus]|nr:IPIL1 protein [Sinosuthora webbiana]